MIVGICDDEKEIRSKICHICFETLKQNGEEDVELRQFSNGEEIEDVELDILILDIDMPGRNGIEIKQRLQVKRCETLIIFVTSHDEYMPQAFGKNVIGFVNKTHLREHFSLLLQTALQIIRQNVIVDGVNSRDILYIQSEQNYCKFFLVNNQNYLSRNSMKQLEKELMGTPLVKIHKSYIVNFAHVDKIKDNQILIQGAILPVSIRRKTAVIEKYKDYCRENARYC